MISAREGSWNFAGLVTCRALAFIFAVNFANTWKRLVSTIQELFISLSLKNKLAKFRCLIGIISVLLQKSRRDFDRFFKNDDHFVRS